MTAPPWKDSVDRVAGRTGLSQDAVAILMVAFGVLILIFPALLGVLVGILLILLGGLWLFDSYQERRRVAERPVDLRPPPPPPP